MNCRGQAGFAVIPRGQALSAASACCVAALVPYVGPQTVSASDRPQGATGCRWPSNIGTLMTDDSGDRRNEHDQARRNRLAKALRDNLKRRKSQSRGRADAPDASAVPDADHPPADRSRQAAADEDL